LVCAECTTRPNVFAALLDEEDGYYTDESEEDLNEVLTVARKNSALKNHAVLQRLEEIIEEKNR
jgi:hypothetical protein